MAWIETLPAGPKRPRRYKVHYKAPDRRSRSATFATMHAARDFERRVEVDKVDGAYIDTVAGKLTVGEYATRLLGLEGAPPEWHHLRRTSLASWRTAARIRILPTLGELPLAKVTAERVRTWQAAMVADPEHHGARSIEVARTCLHRIMAQALTDGRVRHNPVHAVRPAPKPRKRPPTIPTPAEVERIAAAIEPRFRAWVITTGYCALRFGESAGLRWANVDTAGRRLRVIDNLVECEGVAEVGDPKTAKGTRWVDYPDVVAEALEAHAAAYPPGPAGEVFTMPQGGPLARSVFVYRYWSKALASAEVAHMTPHGLRHFGASVAIAAGAHPKAVAEFLGDSSVGMVMDTYAHLFPSAGRTLAAGMERVRAEALASVTPISGRAAG